MDIVCPKCGSEEVMATPLKPQWVLWGVIIIVSLLIGNTTLTVVTVSAAVIVNAANYTLGTFYGLYRCLKCGRTFSVRRAYVRRKSKE